MTPHEQAERAVVGAAVEWKRQYLVQLARGERPNVTYPGDWELVYAVTQLESTPLDPPTATPAAASALQTSHDAARSMRRIVGTVAGEVFQLFLQAHFQGLRGLTADAVQIRLNGTHQSISARVSDLARRGWIQDSGLTQATRSGRQAVVYKVSQAGLDASRHVKEWTW